LSVLRAGLSNRVQPPQYNHQSSCGFICRECGRRFENMNNLQQHMQVHQPRNVRCPLCGNQRFRNAANAVQHVESGYCTSCLGQSNARSQIFNFIQSHDRTRSLLSNDALRIQNGGQWDGTVPEVPYACNYCGQRFRQLSQMMQHEAAKHPHVGGSNPLARIGY